MALGAVCVARIVQRVSIAAARAAELYAGKRSLRRKEEARGEIVKKAHSTLIIPRDMGQGK